MNIGITCYPTYGGSGVIATELGLELAKAGHNIHFISYRLPFRLSRFNRKISFHEVDIFDYPLFKYPPYSLSLSAKMAEVAESENLDILHVHYAMPHATSAYLAKKMVGKRGIKSVTTLHGTDITLVGTHSSFYKITKFSIEKSDGITCVSNYLRDTTRKTFKINKEMKVIYNFIDTKRYKRTVKKNKKLDFVGKDDKVIIHISNFRPLKNIDHIIKVFHLVSREVKSKLLLVGDGPDTYRMRNIVSRLKLEDKVLFLGIQENIIPLLNMSDLYMLPSKSEGFGLSALEALSCEVPVIGTDIGGLKEVVEHGKSGFIFDPEDIDSMTKAAVKILSDNDIRLKMGREARKRSKLFDVNIIVPKYIDYYNAVLNI
jgi:N-acetyl-alpha-D-glucosaminyl L-malate synthase BshA